jgi:hypothetical protein
MSDPHLVMLPFKPNKTQTPFRFASEFNMHGNEEHNEDGKVEVDLVVALELQPIELEVISSIRISSNVTNGFGEAKGTTLVIAFVPAEVTVVSSETINKMLSDTTIKDKHANPLVESSMEEGILIIIQLKPIANLVTIAPSFTIPIIDPR